MRPTRFTSLLLVPALALALAACGGSSPAASKGDDGNGGQSTAASVEASADTGGPGSSQNSGPGSGDVEELANGLEPPNSTEFSRTTAQGGIFVGYESTDSPDSLKGFYESAIPGTGMVVITTSSSQGVYSWIFGNDDQGSSYGGSVSVSPSSTNEGGSTVIVSVAATE